ncbi:OmpP1/FadL family transporter [Shewanella pealeana]|uniref:Membrane protein involved in aromatic hydrocarbon degradation n=1 Tax=Shewanella pealeana (strain ATCC 700345 / ANG-SQ1) TaxID=398579 RepID=A8H3B4_SHEPA|nr:outer membrane protein transport protein [Shewanella pealeana]ABV87051.1 membrane protein involved in aromatic hydrocarbon degradation [Shewanella pealeana ATCC 700345]
MNLNKLTLALTLGGSLIATSVSAAGLGLSQIGTAESVATAGAANVTNNRDASAVVTNPAALSGITDSSTVIGVQYLDVKSEFEREAMGEGTTGTAGQFMPHLSYAKRLNDDWVAGIAMHSPGGLGMSYDNGVAGGPANIINENNIAIVNITASASYQLNDKLSLGASVIAQYADLQIDLFQGTEQANTIAGNNWTPSFALGAMYQLSDSTNLGLTYNYGGKHELALATHLPEPQSMDVNWPQSVDLGIEHQLTSDLTLMMSANWQQWSRYNDKYTDTWGAGMALSYQLNEWTLQSGLSFDSSPLDSADRDVVLPLDKQWRFGLGALKTLDSGSVLGIAYQYQSLGDGHIDGTTNGSLNPIQPQGFYSENRIHFITVSLSF